MGASITTNMQTDPVYLRFAAHTHPSSTQHSVNRYSVGRYGDTRRLKRAPPHPLPPHPFSLIHNTLMSTSRVSLGIRRMTGRSVKANNSLWSARCGGDVTAQAPPTRLVSDNSDICLESENILRLILLQGQAKCCWHEGAATRCTVTDLVTWTRYTAPPSLHPSFPPWATPPVLTCLVKDVSVVARIMVGLRGHPLEPQIRRSCVGRGGAGRQGEGGEQCSLGLVYSSSKTASTSPLFKHHCSLVISGI
ncbi:hypothetical protein E2C01_043959 [Portunus trituberculatus]|uniref:Uncharacterized protein n=1 Tax=Portunus trituberculatus TaxID=210409 RepID=A0A5B7FXJ1_PORTR|nr:hypothetical protein [Portunus trituberculatus]